MPTACALPDACGHKSVTGERMARQISVHKSFGKKNGFRSSDGSSVFSRDLILKETSELMVLLGLLFNQSVGSFDRANWLSIFQFDAVRFIDFSAKDFDRWVQWIRNSCFVFNF